MVDISIVLPIYNERRNIPILYKEIKAVLENLKKKHEIIFVNDGSRDGSGRVINNIREQDKSVRAIHFRRNFGQTAALDAGFKNSNGKVVIALDSDLQDDPKNIPRLLAKLEEGYDVVCSWRYNRRDKLLKKFISRGADFLRKVIFKDRIHDSGCTFKAYRRECLNDLNLYGEMHRFIPAILSTKGYRITEIKVNHRKRIYEKTKYNMKRTIKGLLDMVLIKFWMDFSTRPLHLFGGLGVLSGMAGFLVGLYLTYVKIFQGQSIGNRPLLILAVLMILIGLILLVFGILADILIKIYYKDEKSYSIKEQ